MSTNEVRSSDTTHRASLVTVDMKLEVVVIPVSDVDRAKEFYARLGWRLDADRWCPQISGNATKRNSQASR
jgi:predicted enzyme related to lactoylglutathione lyase